WHLGGDGSLSRMAPANVEPRRFTYDPEHPVPTIGGNSCAVGELPADGPGMEPMWARLLNPVLRLRNVLTPGPADQTEAPQFFASRAPHAARPRSLRVAPPLPAPLGAARRARLRVGAALRPDRGNGPGRGAPSRGVER